jgi:putative acetyltransferase
VNGALFGESSEMAVRRFEASDAHTVCEIYYRSVHEVASAKYDAAQCRAWAPTVPDALWLERLCEYETFVATVDPDKVVAWISMSRTGYIDMLFCLPEATRCGIAAELYAAVERLAIAGGLTELTAHASRLAEPFFRKRGWVVDRYETVVRSGVEIPRAQMSKRLAD